MTDETARLSALQRPARPFAQAFLRIGVLDFRHLRSCAWVRHLARYRRRVERRRVLIESTHHACTAATAQGAGMIAAHVVAGAGRCIGHRSVMNSRCALYDFSLHSGGFALVARLSFGGVNLAWPS